MKKQRIISPIFLLLASIATSGYSAASHSYDPSLRLNRLKRSVHQAWRQASPTEKSVCVVATGLSCLSCCYCTKAICCTTAAEIGLTENITSFLSATNYYESGRYATQIAIQGDPNKLQQAINQFIEDTGWTEAAIYFTNLLELQKKFGSLLLKEALKKRGISTETNINEINYQGMSDEQFNSHFVYEASEYDLKPPTLPTQLPSSTPSPSSFDMTREPATDDLIKTETEAEDKESTSLIKLCCECFFQILIEALDD